MTPIAITAATIGISVSICALMFALVAYWDAKKTTDMKKKLPRYPRAEKPRNRGNNFLS